MLKTCGSCRSGKQISQVGSGLIQLEQVKLGLGKKLVGLNES